MDNFPAVVLVLGGANSGKSAFAERLVRGSQRPRTYIATAQAFDPEMEQKIAAHQRDRGDDWTTVEAPLALAAAISARSSKDIVLIDCLTMWLSNLMLSETDSSAAFEGLESALDAAKGPVVMVSNEVGSGIVPESALGRAFRSAQGTLNQRMAARADLVVLVVAGLPMVLKGQLPEGMG